MESKTTRCRRDKATIYRRRDFGNRAGISLTKIKTAVFECKKKKPFRQIFNKNQPSMVSEIESKPKTRSAGPGDKSSFSKSFPQNVSTKGSAKGKEWPKLKRGEKTQGEKWFKKKKMFSVSSQDLFSI